MTIYELIQQLARFPSHYEVRIVPMKRNGWNAKDRQEIMGVRTIGLGRERLDEVEVYGEAGGAAKP